MKSYFYFFLNASCCYLGEKEFFLSNKSYKNRGKKRKSENKKKGKISFNLKKIIFISLMKWNNQKSEKKFLTITTIYVDKKQTK